MKLASLLEVRFGALFAAIVRGGCTRRGGISDGVVGRKVWRPSITANPLRVVPVNQGVEVPDWDTGVWWWILRPSYAAPKPQNLRRAIVACIVWCDRENAKEAAEQAAVDEYERDRTFVRKVRALAAARRG